MREEYDLKNGRPNPYAKRLGKKGRGDLVQLWAQATQNVRLLPDDIAREHYRRHVALLLRVDEH